MEQQKDLRIRLCAASADIRHGYVVIADDGSGFDILFWEPLLNDYQVIDLNLSYTQWHTLGIEIFFNDGSDNDVVNIYVDGYKVHSGISWEAYHTDAPKSVDRLSFDTYLDTNQLGYGLYFDNILVTDLDHTVFPGAPEICDGLDNDDNDSVYPDAPEVCDSADNNCNGAVDEGATTAFYQDSDLDGYGDPNISEDACVAPSGYVADNTDCNDGDSAINPGAPEVCDGRDNNCDNMLLPDETDSDTDGYMVCENDCKDDNASINPGVPEACNGIDDNCDGLLLPDETDSDTDGYMICEGDCDDADRFTYPGAPSQSLNSVCVPDSRIRELSYDTSISDNTCISFNATVSNSAVTAVISIIFFSGS